MERETEPRQGVELRGQLGAQRPSAKPTGPPLGSKEDEAAGSRGALRATGWEESLALSLARWDMPSVLKNGPQRRKEAQSTGEML